jgi:hypothetical protein
MFVCSKCYVLSGRGLFDGLITRPEAFYRIWSVEIHCVSKSEQTGQTAGRHLKLPFPLAKMKSE